MNERTKKSFYVLCFMLYVIHSFLLYVLVRAYFLSFTWDESYTFLEFVRKCGWFPSEYNNMSANNHWLNTWLMKTMLLLWDDSEISLRLPNVLCYLLFAYYTAMIVLQFQS